MKHMNKHVKDNKKLKEVKEICAVRSNISLSNLKNEVDVVLSG